eukprot:3825269-Pleurochrysis_carterae.AAC.1
MHECLWGGRTRPIWAIEPPHTQHCRTTQYTNTQAYCGAASVPLGRLAGGVHIIAKRFCGLCAPLRCSAIVCCVE